MTAVEELLAPVASRSRSSYLDFPDNAVRWAFEAGLPDPETFPIDDLVRISERVLRTDSANGLQYGSLRQSSISYGYPGLREEILARTPLAPGRELDLSSVMLTNGGIQAITLACRAFLGEGDVIAVEAPTWNAVLAAAAQMDAEAVAVPMDDDGMVVDALEERIGELSARGKRLKLVYTIATFNTPTGLCLSESRRRRLLELAQEHGFLIVEDNVYGELRYDGERIPTIFELDDDGLVVKIDSFSKTLAPALRMGWVTGHPSALAGMAAIRGDLGISQWLARIVAEFLRDGLYEPHLERVNVLYRHKRNVTDEALHAHCGEFAEWFRPDGGFFYWLELGADIDARKVTMMAISEGVACRAGERFFGDGDAGRQFLRLAFTMVPESELRSGIEVLGRALAGSRIG